MNLEEMSNFDLVALSTACDGEAEELVLAGSHDEAACLGCQAWAVYETRGCPVLS